MPEDPIQACHWLLPKLTSALTEAKILPVRLQHLKHQEVLRTLFYIAFIIIKCHIYLNFPLSYTINRSILDTWLRKTAHKSCGGAGSFFPSGAEILEGWALDSMVGSCVYLLSHPIPTLGVSLLYIWWPDVLFWQTWLFLIGVWYSWWPPSHISKAPWIKGYSASLG